MKLTQKNYFSKKANQEYMSVSQFKSFGVCPAKALAEIKGKYEREKTKDLLVGSYVDAYFEGTLANFIKENPEVFTKGGTLRAEYKQAKDIIQRIMKDKLFTEYMSGEKQVIMTGEINGVPIKIKVDSLHPDKIVDLKIMKDLESMYHSEKGHVPFFEMWGYDIQGAVYQEIVRQNTGEKLPFYLAVATKEKVTDIDIVHLNQSQLDYAFGVFESRLEWFDAIKKGIVEPARGGKCEYCKKTQTLTAPTDSDEYYL